MHAISWVILAELFLETARLMNWTLLRPRSIIVGILMQRKERATLDKAVSWTACFAQTLEIP